MRTLHPAIPAATGLERGSRPPPPAPEASRTRYTVVPHFPGPSVSGKPPSPCSRVVKMGSYQANEEQHLPTRSVLGAEAIAPAIAWLGVIERPRGNLGGRHPYISRLRDFDLRLTTTVSL